MVRTNEYKIVKLDHNYAQVIRKVSQKRHTINPENVSASDLLAIMTASKADNFKVLRYLTVSSPLLFHPETRDYVGLSNRRM